MKKNTIIELLLLDGVGEITLNYDRSEVYPPSHYARNFAQILLDQPLNGMRILDVGCGTGILGIVAAKRGANVFCSDLNKTALFWTDKNAKLNNVEVTTIQSDGVSELLGQEKFDLVICNAPSNPGYFDAVVTPKDNGALGRGLLDAVLIDGRKLLKREGKLLSCSNSEQDWDLTNLRLEKLWSGYTVIADVDEDFGSLDQFTPAQLEDWVARGVCWKKEEIIMHNVKYFFAYN